MANLTYDFHSDVKTVNLITCRSSSNYTCIPLHCNIRCFTIGLYIQRNKIQVEVLYDLRPSKQMQSLSDDVPLQLRPLVY